MNKISKKIIFSSLLLILFNTNADINEKHELAYKAFTQFLRSTIFLTSAEFSDVPSAIRKIAIVRTSDKHNKMLSKRTNSLIEDKIRDRIIAGNKFQIIECLECGSKKIAIKNNKLVVDDFLESNENVRKVGRKLDIDGFLFWDAFIEGTRITINFKLVQAIDNRILWTKQYSGPYDATSYNHFSLDLYIGMLGYDVKLETNTGGLNEIKLDNLAKAGIRLREKFSALDLLEFSIGVEYFGPISKRDIYDINGVAAEARMVLDILPLMKNLRTNLYLASGPAYYKSQLSIFFKYGIEIPFQRFGYISFGGQYMPEKEITLAGEPGYKNQAKFGGSSYDLTIGIRL